MIAGSFPLICIYDRKALCAHVERSLPLLNRDQDRAIASILNAVHLDQGGFFFWMDPTDSERRLFTISYWHLFVTKVTWLLLLLHLALLPFCCREGGLHTLPLKSQ